MSRYKNIIKRTEIRTPRSQGSFRNSCGRSRFLGRTPCSEKPLRTGRCGISRLRSSGSNKEE